MSTIELTNKINELRELENMMDELKAEIKTIKDSIKSHMVNLGVEELLVGTHIIRWTTVLSNRFDGSSFKKVIDDRAKLINSIKCEIIKALENSEEQAKAAKFFAESQTEELY